MANGDSKYRSRKFVLAGSSLLIVTLFAGYSLIALAADGGDAALIMGAWAGSDTTILGLYNYVNMKTGGG
jgi:hypothetical protein